MKAKSKLLDFIDHIGHIRVLCTNSGKGAIVTLVINFVVIFWQWRLFYSSKLSEIRVGVAKISTYAFHKNQDCFFVIGIELN